MTGLASTASATTNATFTRVQGADRYATAVATAKLFGTVSDVILASGEPGHTVDALSASVLAGFKNAPILLTKQAATPQSVLDQIKASGAQNIWIVGGTSAVSAAQEQALKDAGYAVARLAGADRWGTAADIINHSNKSTTALIATGLDFPDALGGGALSYAAGLPMGIVKKDTVPAETLDALKNAGVTQVIILGGEGVVSASVVSQLAAEGITVKARLGGANRAETSTLLADYEVANYGFTNTAANIASGYAFGDGADALGGAAFSGEKNTPLLITNSATKADPLATWLTAHAKTVAGGTVFGGPGAVSDALVAQLQAAARKVTSNQAFTVSPTTDQSNSADSDDTKDNVSFTVSDIKSSTVDIAIVPAENVKIDANGVVTFADDENTTGDTTVLEGNDQADLGSTPAHFVTVNGATVGGQYVNDAAVVNGSVQFSIDSAELDKVRVVVFDDANDNNNVDLNASNEPTEDFAVTGVVTFTAPAATTGSIGTTALGGVNVLSNDEAANSFVGADIIVNGAPGAETQDNTKVKTYSYDSNDQFYKDAATPANQLTLAQFEAALSAGDDVSGSYNENPELVSQFVLVDEAPTAPTSVAADQTSGAESTSATITWAEPTSGEPDTFNVYRSSKAAPNFPDDYTKVGSVSGDTLKFVDSGLTKSTTYTYAVTAVENGDESDEDTDTVTTAATNTTDTGAPTSIDAVVTTNKGLVGTFDSGDAVKLVFSEAMAAPTVGDTIRANDNDGTVGDFVNGTNATFALNTAAETVNGVSRAAGTVLTVTLNAVPTIVTAGGTAGLQIPAVVTDQSGTTDVAGNAWNVVGSADATLDQDADDNNATPNTVPAQAASLSPQGGNYTLTADDAGVDGNNITYEVVQGTGNSTPLGVDVSGDAITVTLPTDGTGAAQIATTAAVVAALNSDAAAGALVDATGGDGTTATVYGPANLSGGTDPVFP